jgi:hypothetical protein
MNNDTKILCDDGRFDCDRSVRVVGICMVCRTVHSRNIGVESDADIDWFTDCPAALSICRNLLD